MGSMAAVIAALAAVAALLLGLAQFERANDIQEENNRLRRAQLDSHLNEVMMGLDRHFVSYPELRPFFYSPQARALPLRQSLRAQAMGTAELIIDFADAVSSYTRMQKMNSRSRQQWAGITRSYFKGSPVIRFAWQTFHNAYDESTACILGAPFKESEFERWHWQSNSPPAPLVEECQ
jgi:hypothetical protein